MSVSSLANLERMSARLPERLTGCASRQSILGSHVPSHSLITGYLFKFTVRALPSELICHVYEAHAHDTLVCDAPALPPLPPLAPLAAANYGPLGLRPSKGVIDWFDLMVPEMQYMNVRLGPPYACTDETRMLSCAC